MVVAKLCVLACYGVLYSLILFFIKFTSGFGSFSIPKEKNVSDEEDKYIATQTSSTSTQSDIYTTDNNETNTTTDNNESSQYEVKSYCL